MKLFGRWARVTVGTLVVQMPSLDFVFNCEASTAPSPNKASIKIYNLAPNNRLYLASLSKIPCQVEAGYDDSHGTIFLGDLRTVQFGRDGGDIWTEISAGDGEQAYRESRVNLQVPKGASIDDVAQQLVTAMGLGLGNTAQAFADLQLISGRQFPTGRAMHGNAAREFTALCRAAGAEWSCQRGKVQVLATKGPRSGVKPAQAIHLSPGTGLVGTPTINSSGLAVAKCLLIPDIHPGTIVTLTSEFVKGQFVVQSAKYSGETKGQAWYVDIEGKRY